MTSDETLQREVAIWLARVRKAEKLLPWLERAARDTGKALTPGLVRQLDAKCWKRAAYLAKVPLPSDKSREVVAQVLGEKLRNAGYAPAQVAS